MKKIIRKILKFQGRTLTVLIVLAILVVVNFLSYQIFTRFDLTENRIYSLSLASKNTIRELDDIVRINVLFSENLPGRYTQLRQKLNDILDEYRIYSDGRVMVRHKDPKKTFENTRVEMSKLGIPEIQFNVLKDDSYQVTQGYMGVSIRYGDKQEAIPVVKNIDNLEYQLTSIIKKVTEKEKSTLGLVTSHGCLDKKKEISAAYGKLSEVYDIKDVDLKEDDAVPAEVNTLLIIGPDEEFADEELGKIEDLIGKSDKSLIAIVDGVIIEEGLRARKNPTNLDEFLEDYGIKMNKDVVLDLSSAPVRFSSGFMTIIKEYPGWVKVTEDNFSKDDPAVASLDTATLPWPSSLERTEEGGEVSVLMKSTKKSWKQEDDFRLAPDMELGSPDDQQYSLAMMAPVGEEAPGSNIIVIGDSDLINDQFIEREEANLVLFQNLVDSVALGGGADLIEIRSKKVFDRPIKDISLTHKKLIKYGNIFAIPALVIIIGLVRYFWRKTKYK